MQNKLHDLVANPDTNIDVIKKLIQAEKIDINSEHTIHGTRPICFAAQSGSLATLQYLIEEEKADLNATDDKHNLLYWAQSNPFSEVLDYVSDPKNKLIEKFNDGTNHLHAAVIKADIPRIDELLSTQPELIQAQNKQGETALFLAALGGTQTLVQAITQHPSFTRLDDVEKFDSLYRGQAQYSYKQGEVYEADDDYAKAIPVFKEAIRSHFLIKNKDNSDRYLLGLCYLSLGQCNYLHFIFIKAKTLEKRLVLNTKDALAKGMACIESLSLKGNKEFYLLAQFNGALGNLFYSMDDYPSAIDEFTKAQKYYNQVRQAYSHLVDKVGRDIEDCQRALRIMRLAQRWGLSCHMVDDANANFLYAACHQMNSERFKADILAHSLRTVIVWHIKENMEKIYKPFLTLSPEDYLTEISKPETPVDHLMIMAFSRQYNINVVIIKSDGSNPHIIKRPNSVATFYFAYNRSQYFALGEDNTGEASLTGSLQAVIRRSPVDEWVNPYKNDTRTEDAPPHKKQKKSSNSAPQSLANAKGQTFFPATQNLREMPQAESAPGAIL